MIEFVMVFFHEQLTVSQEIMQKFSIENSIVAAGACSGKWNAW